MRLHVSTQRARKYCLLDWICVNRHAYEARLGMRAKIEEGAF